MCVCVCVCVCGSVHVFFCPPLRVTDVGPNDTPVGAGLGSEGIDRALPGGNFTVP